MSKPTKSFSMYQTVRCIASGRTFQIVGSKHLPATKHRPATWIYAEKRELFPGDIELNWHTESTLEAVQQ